jgi:hypothetical protein
LGGEDIGKVTGEACRPELRTTNSAGPSEKRLTREASISNKNK